MSAQNVMVYAHTLEEIRESLAIVVGYPVTDFIDREHGTEYYYDPDIKQQLPENRWTLGPFRITRVLYQKPDFELSAGQTISLVEPVGLFEDRQGELLKKVTGDCYEMKQNSEYVVFIGKSQDGTCFGADNYNLGRFNTDGTDLEDELGVVGGYNTDGTPTDKQKLRDEITGRYGIRFAPIGSSTSPQTRQYGR
ncbi:MAG: hypothetical protein H8F28_05030 [Fibrella sp.]|nr:hypothetical protein [Armatimonadota bacterium]